MRSLVRQNVARLVVLGIGAAILVIAAFNIRVVGTECLQAFADGDPDGVFATCEAEEFRSVVHEFWEIQEPDDYIASRCEGADLRDSFLCASR